MFGRRKRELLAHGKQAPAVIVHVEDRWVGSNTTHPFLVTLRVRPDDEPEFEFTKKLRFPRLAPPRPGAVLWVRYDPSDHSRVEIDSGRRVEAPAGPLAGLGAGQVIDARNDPALREQVLQALAQQGVDVSQIPAAGQAAAGASVPADPLDRLKKLAELRDAGVLTSEEFETQKRKILGET